MLSLAEEYRRASAVLHKLHKKGQPLSLVPFRLTTIHAIELYLSAMLLAHGRQPREIRALGHDLLKRAQLAQGFGLNLRKRTVEHLGSLCANREYLVSRYAPELGRPAFHVNQLLATLDDVAEKTSVIVEAAEPKPRPAPLCR